MDYLEYLIKKMPLITKKVPFHPHYVLYNNLNVNIMYFELYYYISNRLNIKVLPNID